MNGVMPLAPQDGKAQWKLSFEGEIVTLAVTVSLKVPESEVPSELEEPPPGPPVSELENQVAELLREIARQLSCFRHIPLEA